MFRVVLAPLDGSALSETALPFAAALVGGGGRLVLLRAVPPHAPPGSPHADAGGEERAALEVVESYLTDVRLSLDARLRVETVARAGQAGATIVREAERQRADLVVMTSHGRAGPSRALFGSVADHAMRHASVPVLIVPPRCDRAWPGDRPLRVMVPLDGSDFSERALWPARDLAQTLQTGRGAEVILLRVIDQSAEIYHRRASRELFFDLDTALKAARGYLRSCTHALRDVTPRVGVRAVAGLPGPTIARAAQELGADLIAMATHGRSGVSRVLAGSVATETLRRSRVPVLLVRPYALPAVAPREAVTPHETASPQEAVALASSSALAGVTRPGIPGKAVGIGSGAGGLRGAI